MINQVTKFSRTMALIIHHDANKRKIIIVILLINIIKGLLFSALTPLWQAPDEPFYFSYTKILVEEIRIPSAAETTAAGHPLLYPLISSIPYYAGKLGGENLQVFLMRFVGVLLSSLVVWLTFKTVSLLFPHNIFIQFLAPILVTFNPQYSFISASINSDVLLVFFSSLLLYLLVKIVVSSLTPLRLLWLLLVITAGLLTKERFWLFIFPLVLILVYELIRSLRSRFFPLAQESVLLPFLFMGAFSLIALRSQSVLAELTGVRAKFLDPLGADLLGKSGLSACLSSLRYIFFHQSYSRSFSLRMFEEFWGFFGWLQIPLSPGIYTALKIFCYAAALGLLIGAAKILISKIRRVDSSTEDTLKYNKPSSTQQLFILLTLLATVLITFYAVAIYDIATGSPGRGGGQGRYFFPVIVPISILTSIGIHELVPKRAQKQVSMILFLAFFILNVTSLVYFIMPFYY